MVKHSRCAACGGSGILCPAVPSCNIPALVPPWIVVERCDECGKYEDDLSAALARFKIAGWFRCTDGGEHALAEQSSERSIAEGRLLKMTASRA